jgi:hypothetical protein
VLDGIVLRVVDKCLPVVLVPDSSRSIWSIRIRERRFRSVTVKK